ncbi:MAG: hypothetical protein WC010_02775 [Candidatus Absconditabacterales bacterium]
MGKVINAIDIGALRLGNTIATPARRGGETANALANILRQGQSSAKNVAEVGKQTLDALVDNFLNFSKVEGKRYQRLIKGTVNLVSAITRRPAMIAGAGVLSALNQGIRRPFKKLAPGKLFKGLKNATRIFSKKKGFDFQKYDTDDTKGDTRVNQITEKRKGFLGKGGSSEKSSKEEKPVEKKSIEVKKVEESKKVEVKKPEEIKKAPDEPKSIDDVKKKRTEESAEKEKIEHEKTFPEWKTLDKEKKEEFKKEYNKTLKNKLNKQGIIERGKTAKMGDTPEEIMKNFKEKDPTFVGYMEEILKKTKN